MRESFESLCIAVILALFVRTFVVQAFKIPSGSMEKPPDWRSPAGQQVRRRPDADLSLSETLLPIDRIRRGDIIVFKHPEDPERDLIKRTIGLPGETIELRNKTVYINGAPLDEPVRPLPLPADA